MKHLILRDAPSALTSLLSRSLRFLLDLYFQVQEEYCFVAV